ncbi:MAG: PSD1 and planctomycete cytochrome C domain-containing protein, partial [Bythopirellula sp.]
MIHSNRPFFSHAPLLPTTIVRLVPVHLVCLILSVVAAAAPQSVGNDQVNFNRDIRPLLSDRCYFCHGPDANHRQAELRLDVAAEAHQRIITPRQPAASEFITRITSDDADVQMPPADSGKTLSNQEIALLTRWIEQGAKYEAHWSFQTPRRVDPVPAAGSLRAWVRNPIDAFIVARLQEKGLQPAQPADRTTLIRRVTLDLTGLPPTPEEVDAFVDDTSPNAYEKVVDRLLASPRYGERMAQEWLDAARYADTMGYQADWERYQWRWRSWVVDAYNRNLPFDQFTIEQLAGDLLPNPTTDQLIATGFNRNHRINDEAGIIPAEYLVEYVVDRVETTCATWIGLTMGCARCHDHKFDPFSQRDFYRLFAFFNRVPEKGKEGRQGYADPYLRVAVRGREQQYLTAQQVVADAEAVLTAAQKPLAAEQRGWEKQVLTQLQEAQQSWRTVTADQLTADAKVDFALLDDHSYLVSGSNFDRPSYEFELQSRDLRRLTAVRLEALTHKSLSGGSLSPGGGNFVLTNFAVEILRDGADQPESVAIASATADYEQANYPIAHAIDAKERTGWAVDGARKRSRRVAEFVLSESVELQSSDRVRIRMAHKSQFQGHAIGRFRLALSDLASTTQLATQIPKQVRKILQTPSTARTPPARDQLANYFVSVAPSTAEERNLVANAKQTLAQFEKQFTTYVMVMREMPEPRPTHVLERGVYTKPGERVEAAVPTAVLGGLPAGAQSNRLGLAQWLVSGEHPLTARVVVNRYWNLLFGRGLVETVEDFGLQGSYPSHPQLLDWLATEYPRNGWDTKALLRLMVTSNTYRQVSVVTPELTAIDPNNRLLARMSRFRLPAETIRDQALFASGLLVEQLGGPSVKPYQPPGLWQELSFQDKNRTTDFYVQGAGNDLYRRSLYTFWKRSVPPPLMETFDAPSREACVLSRSRTNTPLQALALMNDVTYVEASRKLAERAMGAHDDVERQITFAFRRLLARRPSEFEGEALRRGFEKRLGFFVAKPQAAAVLVEQGESAVDKSLDRPQLAALTT